MSKNQVPYLSIHAMKLMSIITCEVQVQSHEKRYWVSTGTHTTSEAVLEYKCIANETGISVV